MSGGSPAREVTRPQLHTTSESERQTPPECNRKKAVHGASRRAAIISYLNCATAQSKGKQIIHGEDNQATRVFPSSSRHFFVRTTTRVFVYLTGRGVWRETCLLFDATSGCCTDTDCSTCLACPCGLARHQNRHARPTDLVIINHDRVFEFPSVDHLDADGSDTWGIPMTVRCCVIDERSERAMDKDICIPFAW